MSTQPSNAGRESWLGTLGWAAYLACSWTWCIGMFLPVLLVRDYGVWGFVVFAVPNVVGAAAMGWVLRDGAAERIATNHKFACLSFTAVTVAFQLYFLTAYLGFLFPTRLFHGSDSSVNRLVMLMFVGGLIAGIDKRVGIVVWLVSAVLVATAARSNTFEVPIVGSSAPSLDLLCLAPVCAFGFALCPYLDLTFLQARRSTSRSHAHAAFGLGFGVFFFAAILTTLAYAPAALSSLDGTGSITVRAASLLSGYVVLQLAYTSGVHIREAARAAAISNESSRASREFSKGFTLSALLFVLGVTSALAASWLQGSDVIARLGIDSRELIYRLFMSFYGLVFPAYVWLCMIPTRDGHSGITGPRGRLKLAVLAVVTLLAAPCYWLGFIEREEIWLVPGLGIVLLARLVVRERDSQSGLHAAN